MVMRKIKYTDYNGVEREEPFYFDYSQAEIIQMELTESGGLSNRIQRVLDSKNVPEIMKLFKWLLETSYGEKSSDGREFVKSPEITKRFLSTPAYSVLYMELLTDAKKAADFVKAVLPEIESKAVIASDDVINVVK